MSTSRSKLVFCVGTVLAISVISVYFFSPKFVLSQTELNLGTLHKGQKACAAVFIRNIGCRTLRILHVDTMCECTTARTDKQELKPGECARLSIQLDSSTLLGDIHRLVSVQTDAPVNSMVFVPVSCKVVALNSR